MSRKKNFYAVKVGVVPGIYATLEECLQNVNGYPGAKYKGFFTKDEAEEYMREIDSSSVIPYNNDIPTTLATNDQAIAYVDGTYSPELKRYGYGVVFISLQTEKHVENGYGDDADKIEYRNITGEILGALTAMRLAVQGGFSKLTLCYDYEGIEKWLSGEWKAKNDLSREYIDRARVYMSQVSVSFYHIQAHSGIELNEEADRLAKSAIQQGINPVRGVITNGATWLTVSGVQEDELDCIISLMIEQDGELQSRKNPQNNINKYTLLLHNERITIMHYKTSAKLCVQGNKGELYNLLISFLGELIEPSKITETLNTFYDVQIKDDIIERAYGYYLPSVVGLPNELLALVRQALYNTLLCGKMFDYGHLVTPALRVVEYHLKKLLNQNDISTSSGFICFEKTYPGSEKYQLNTDTRHKISDKRLIPHINDVYNFVAAHRHTLLHAEPGIGCINDVRLVGSQEEAKSIIIKALSMFNAYYENFCGKHS